MKFSSHNINPTLLSSLTKLNYISTTPVQEATLVSSLKGKSLIAKSETGSGKTHAYLIPIINNLMLDLNMIQAIIFEPTVELCIQCYKFAEDIALLNKNFRVINACNITTEKVNLDRPGIIITTPAKLIELAYKRKNINISKVKTIVLDECDMLLEGDSSQEVISLIDRLNVDQKLIFTATMKEHQITSLKKLFNINLMFDVDKGSYTSKNVTHHFVNIKHRPLDEALKLFIATEKPYFTLVFASKKEKINQIYKSLCNDSYKCALLTSDIPSRERKNILRRINEGEFELVLCSDLASRGLDFEKVSHVISLDIPSNIDYYYHRSGRTGRYNSKGDSLIFYDDDLNQKSKQQLEKKLTFTYHILRNEGLKLDKKRIPQAKKKNEKLEAEIQKELAKVRSKKVKPNYKKKMRRAVEKATENHKRKIIMENLRNKRKAMASKDN